MFFKTNTVLYNRQLDGTYNNSYEDEKPFYLIEISKNKYCVRKGLRKAIITILERKRQKDCTEYHITSNYHRKGYAHIVSFYTGDSFEYNLIKFINESYKEAMQWKYWTLDNYDAI